MKSYFIFRYFTPVLLMIGWVLYQLVIKKKKWGDVLGDAMVCGVFAAVWVVIVYWLSS